MSLDKVTQLTGISKSMLGQIERGESNPTINTLWKVANGLKVSFTSLIKDHQPDTLVIKRDEIEPLIEDDGKYRLYPFFPFEEDRRFEMYMVEIEPGGNLSAERHGDLLSIINRCCLFILGKWDFIFQTEIIFG